MDDLDDDDGALEALQWCRRVRGTINWGRDFDEPICSVEVRSPDSSLEILRGCGPSFTEACRMCREKYDLRCQSPRPTMRAT